MLVLRGKCCYQRGHKSLYCGFRLATSTFVLSILDVEFISFGLGQEEILSKLLKSKLMMNRFLQKLQGEKKALVLRREAFKKRK